MSITMTPEELTREYMNGKSIKRLSQEMGKGEWAIRKQIQRYRNSQKASQETEPVSQEQEQPVRVTLKQKPPNKFAAILAAIGFMVILYFIYMGIKKRRDNRND